MAKPSSIGTPSRTLQRRLLSQLQLERSAHGHGMAAALDQRLGKSEGYIGRVLRGEISLQTEQLFKMLEVFEVEPATFFAAVVGSETSPRLCLRRFARTLDRESSQSVLPISSEMLETLRGLQAPQDGSHPTQPYLAWKDKALCTETRTMADTLFSAEGDQDLLAQVAELMAAAHRAYARGCASGNVLAEALRLAASVEGQHGRDGSAALWLQLALEVVERSSQTEVELLVEVAHLLAARRQLVAASLVIDEAQREAVRLGGGHSLGKTLLARGAIELAKGHLSQAVESYGASFQYLDREAWRDRFLAHHGAARGHLEAGELFEAGRHLTQAAAQHRTLRGPHWTRLQWTRGAWAHAGAKRPEDYERAAQLYTETLAGLDARQQPLDTARLLMHKAKALLALRATERLRRTAATGLQLTQQLKKQIEVHGVIMEFARLAMTGEVTEAWLDATLLRLASLGAGHRGRRKPTQ